MTPDHSSPARRPTDGTHAGGGARRAAGPGGWQGVDHASRSLADLLAGLFVWGGAGWLVDGWLGTTPWVMAIGIMSGFAGGLYLVWLRATRPVQRDATAQGRAAPRRTVDDRDSEG